MSAETSVERRQPSLVLAIKRAATSASRVFTLVMGIKLAIFAIMGLRKHPLSGWMRQLQLQGAAEFPFASFLSCAVGSFTVLRCLLQLGVTRIAGKLSSCSDQLCTVSAAMIAGTAMALDGGEAAQPRRTSFALYTGVRASEFCLNGLTSSGWLPEWGGFDTAMFCASCSRIMYAWFYAPDTLPVHYEKWITLMSEVDPRLRAGLRALHLGSAPGYESVGYGTRSDILASYCNAHGVDPALGDLVSCIPVPSQVVHPLSPNGLHNFCRRWIRGFIKALLIYTPIHVVPIMVFAPASLLNNPVSVSLVRIGSAVVRSSGFLASFIAIVWGAITTVRAPWFLNDDRVWGPLIGSSLCGLSLLIEKKSRRKELAMYVLPRAVESSMKSWPHLWQGWLKAEPLVFSLSCAGVLFHFEHGQSNIRPSILRLMRWCFAHDVGPVGGDVRVGYDL
eukprot:TRINITY_DN27696_c0_g1_i2.p1 TRINITY_DN27696_c0_g1~~TRINITY_DN27696_c0_g1_i2.p1  ORF type:complete len:448 (-),score=89.77 TRINITY_DN27696_c0_g1_i2:202-1545(-)